MPSLSSSDRARALILCHWRRGNRCSSLPRLGRDKCEHRTQPYLPSTLPEPEDFRCHSPAAWRTIERLCQRGRTSLGKECPSVLGPHDPPYRRSDKSVSEYLARARCVVAIERLKNDVVAALRVGRPIP